MADPTLKAALKARELIVAPGVFDLISALVADRLGFKALYVTGYGVVASYLGLPDAGIATYRDMVERISQIAKLTKTQTPGVYRQHVKGCNGGSPHCSVQFPSAHCPRV